VIVSEAGTSDPVCILLDDHRRIETALTVLTRYSESPDGQPLAVEDRQPILMALACFRETVPQHAADEEESLFPRIREQQDSRVLPVLARIESLEEEHVCADRLHVELDGLCRTWLARNGLLPGGADRIRALLKQVRNLYRHHLAVEETEVFPLVAMTFTDMTMNAVCEEMAFRRRRAG
jgi:hemerythrin-like domain-containing protein